MAIWKLGLVELRARMRAGEVTPVDAVDAVLGAIEARDGDVRAFIDVYADQARATARRMLDGGDWKERPLGGVPIAVKDNICVAGHRTTCASRILDGYRSPYTATCVERLEAAGAIVIGKTNLDEFAMGSSTENSAFGPTSNPWDHERVPGGSSGGSAAAVAAGMAFGALGSDTGGSIRQPASFCGAVGVKPTWGRVSRYGLVAFASSFDQVGPIARSVRDAALLLSVIAGGDERDATSFDRPVPDYDAMLERGVDGLRVGVPHGFLNREADAEVLAAFEALLGRLNDAGAVVRHVDLPNSAVAVPAYYVVANAEASANLARFDGVRYGFRAGGDENVSLLDVYTRTRDAGFGDEVKRRVLLGTYVLSAGYYDAYYSAAQKVRSLITADFSRAFDSCDVVLSPTTPTPAFRLGEKVSDPVAMYLCDVFTVPANLAGLPAVSVPFGSSRGGLPLGAQVVGQRLDEATVLRAARGLEEISAFDARGAM